MKSIWKGSIAFGLVSIRVQLYTAQESHALGFTLLHDTCHTPLKYHRWCPKCKKEVIWQDTVKGIKKSNGSYVILTQEMLRSLKPETTDEIKIVEFVAADQIPIIYLNHHYYIAPQKKDDTAFALFHKALEKLDKVAIGQFVMREKEYVCTIKADKGYLLLTTLHYAYEVRGAEKLVYSTKMKLQPTELKLAQEFIEKLSVKTFDITAFKDTFAQAIKKRLAQKTPTKKRAPKKTTVSTVKKRPTLTESLRGSLNLIQHKPAARAKKR
jgi:DNA end-binding protein Ku